MQKEKQTATLQIFAVAFKRILKRLILPLCIFAAVILAVCVCALIISGAVCNKTKDRILTPEQILADETEVDCILVLGCRVHPDGRLSHMLSDRVETAVSLYHAGVSDHLLMSGDKRTIYYNEVDPMRDAAIAQGVPADAISMDGFGLSTYDSVARLAEEYQGKKVVIVTQRYHLFRALYIAEKLGIDAYGVSADLRTYTKRVWWETREVLARCKDVYYAEKRPAVAGT